MADSGETASEAPQITFKVKTSGDKIHTLTMSESATVLDLKTKLATAEFEDVPVERQRLIYSGRVMKNDDALSVYKIKNLNTIHMVKSAPSNPTPAPAGTSTTPTPPAVPQNMAAGTSAGNLLAGLTGARFAGHANLPGRDMFGADGGMGAPPDEDQIAEMLSNPNVAQTMSEALNNPAFVDYMIQSNPMLANMPNAREMLQSQYFREMLTNPEAIRAASRMRRMMSGGGAGGFPMPGVTDTTPGAAASSPQGANNAGAGAAAAAQNPFAAFFQPNPFGEPPASGAPGAAPANPFGGPDVAQMMQQMFGNPAGGAAATGAAAGTGAAASGTTPSSGPQSPRAAAGENTNTNTQQQQAANPFASLFGAGFPGAGANANPWLANMPPPNPEALQNMMQMLGMAGPGAGQAAPPDNRPPEERYAEQLRQLNDMGFFDFDRNVAALRRSGGSVQGAIEHLLNGA